MKSLEEKNFFVDEMHQIIRKALLVVLKSTINAKDIPALEGMGKTYTPQDMVSYQRVII